MKKLLLAILAVGSLALTGCKNTPTVRNSGDVYDITSYETRVYCTYESPCEHCDSWTNLSEEDLHKAKSVTCTYMGEYNHFHYCVTWVV